MLHFKMFKGLKLPLGANVLPKLMVLRQMKHTTLQNKAKHKDTNKNAEKWTSPQLSGKEEIAHVTVLKSPEIKW